jgi:threonine aldolase
MEIIDLRSDTVTKPTPAMREAMSKAEVGDDVYGEDPSVNRLQEMAAEIAGKQAAIFVPSGTMGNLAAVLTHCGRGDEVILGDLAHTFLYEAGGIAALGGVHPHTLPNQTDGSIKIEDIRAAIRGDDPHFPRTRLIALESTHNRRGGVALSLDYIKSVGALAQEHGLKLHLDGARLFNATVDLGIPAKDYAAPLDSLTFCLSKALSAPVGSLLCGTEEFIGRAHRARKQLGGGMRQAGIIAAAGIVALEHMIERLADDHARAKRLAQAIGKNVGIDVYAQNTNMVYIEMAEDMPLSEDELLDELGKRGIKIGQVGGRKFRMVTHYWIDDDAVNRVIQTFAEIGAKS